MKPVSAGALFRLVRQLANQCPTRYWNDGMGNGEFSHYKICIWLPYMEACPNRLIAEMEDSGFWLWQDPVLQGDQKLYTFMAEREVKVPL